MEHPSFFIDFEASGIAPDSYPIEVAVVSADISFHALIRPARYWTFWSFDSEDMHGISQDVLHRDGQAPKALAEQMNQLFSGQVICSDSPQDGFWLDTLYEAAEMEATFDLRPLESFVSREAAGKIYLHLPSRRHHRALPDATALRDAYEAFLRD